MCHGTTHGDFFLLHKQKFFSGLEVKKPYEFRTLMKHTSRVIDYIQLLQEPKETIQIIEHNRLN